MKNKYYLVMLVLLFSSCSTPVQNELTQESKDLPRWVTDIDEYCETDQLCAVGEGMDLSSSEISARTALARIFSVQINARSYYSTDYELGESEESLIEETFSKHIEGAVDQLQEGVQVSKRTTYVGRFFSLAWLSKVEAKKRLEGRLREMNSQLRVYNRDFLYSDIFAMRELLVSFDALNNIYFQVAGKYYPKVITKAKLLEMENKHFSKSVGIFLDVDVSSNYSFVKTFLSNFFLSKGYKIVNDSSNASYSLTAKIRFIKEHLNVDGFDKRKVMFSIKNSKESNGIAFKEELIFRSIHHLKELFINRIEGQMIKQFRFLKLN